MKISYISDSRPVRLPEHILQLHSLRDTPSLTRAVRDPEADAFVLDQRTGCTYSLPHILSAARTAAFAGKPFILLGQCSTPHNSALRVTEDPGELPALLEMPMKERVSASPEQVFTAPAREASKDRPYQVHRPRLLHRHNNTILRVAVVGSQSRIGTTTQCLQLYHYFSALGCCDPAIMASKAAIDELASVMSGEEAGNHVIFFEKIPFLTDMQEPFDLYIQDCGLLTQESLAEVLNGDLVFLVAGSKPWEIRNTAEALALLREKQKLAVIFSYSTESVVNEFLAGVGDLTALTAPWQPELLQQGDMEPYDKALWPMLEPMFLS